MRKYFSKAVYLNTLRRFWAGALLIVLFFVMMAIGYGQMIAGDLLVNHEGSSDIAAVRNRAGAELLQDYLLASGIFLAFAGVFCSILLFAYLHNKRAPVMLHALPVRREAHFCSVFLAGLTLLWGGALFGTIAFAVTQAGYGVFFGASVGWFLLMMLLCSLIAFSMTTLAAFLTGSSVGQFLLTALLAGLPLLLELFFNQLCASYLFGYSGATLSLNKMLHPIYLFGILAADAPSWLAGYYSDGISASQVGSIFMLFGYCLIAIALSLLLYRKRRLECAGDFVAVRGMRPVFRYGSAFFTAFLFGIYGQALHTYNNGPKMGWMVFGILGGAIGFFIAEMFIRKTVKVWRHWKGAVLFGACYAALVFSMMFDVFGYGSYVLPKDQVESIYLSEYGSLHESNLHGRLLPILYQFTGDDMDAALALQEYIAKEGQRTTEEMNDFAESLQSQSTPIPAFPSAESDTRAEESESPFDKYHWHMFFLEATLTNGKTVTRQYDLTLPTDDPEWNARIDALDEAVKPQMIERLCNLGTVARRLDFTVWLSGNFDDMSTGKDRVEQFSLYGDDVAGFISALVSDNSPYWEYIYSDRNWSQRSYDFMRVDAELDDDGIGYTNDHIEMTVFADNENAIAWLREHGLLTQEMEAQLELLLQLD